jgi:citronellol/citronellal dehydrogenase
VVAAKTTTAHPSLPGTIYTAAEEIEKAGGKALPLVVDIRHEESVENAVKETMSKFKGIDILINNASAIWPMPTTKTPMKKYDLITQVNGRGTYMVTQKCAQALAASSKAGRNPHVLNLSPPLSMRTKWFAPHVAYTTSKYMMSMCTLGHAGEFKPYGVAVNSLWPRTAIATSAVEWIGGDKMMKASRTVDIMAEAAYVMLTQPSTTYTGNFAIDDSVLMDLANETPESLKRFAVSPGSPLAADFFVDDAEEVLDKYFGGHLQLTADELAAEQSKL